MSLAFLPKALAIPSHPTLTPLYRQANPFTTSAILLKFKRYPKPRKPERRHLEGDALEAVLQQKVKGRAIRLKYYQGLQVVIQRWRVELQQKAEAEAKKKAALLALTAGDKDEVLKARQQNKELLDQHNAKQAARRAGLADPKSIVNARFEEKHQQRREALREMNTEMILKVIEESKNFITLDNLDEQLDIILEEEVNFNFAITQEGGKIFSTKPPGNLDGWKGASPAAYVAGDLHPDTNEFIAAFEGKGLGSYLKRGGLFGKRRVNER